MSDEPKIKIPTESDIERILYSEETIKAKTRELGEQIGRDYSAKRVEEILVISILKGAALFSADLIRSIDHDIRKRMDYMILSSYGEGFSSSGNVKVVLDLGEDIANKEVLVVEDIVDTGNTLNFLINGVLNKRNPASVKLCTLLDKPSRRGEGLSNLKPDYVGFEIPDVFVVGYGLDYMQYCRDWPFVAVLKEEFYKK
ncbi:MAG: hypoxanthine phosphoribosyltransferase [Nanoarchaeota archaeon]